MNTIKKIIITLIVVCLTLGIGLVVYGQYKENRNESARLNRLAEEYNSKLRVYRKEEEKLNEELDEIYEELYTGDLGTTIILLTDTYSDHLDETIPLIERYGYKGVIVLNHQHMPDDNKRRYLTRDDIDALVEDGYDLVIKATVSEEITKTYKRFKDLGYEIKGVYFEDIAVTNLMAEQIRDLDENMVIIGNYLDGVGVSDTLLINYYGSRQQNVKAIYEDAINKSKVVALTVGYEKSINRYDEENFKSMLKEIRDYVYEDRTEVCTIEKAIERNNIYNDKLAKIEPERYTRVIEIKTRLKEIADTIMEMDLGK